MISLAFAPSSLSPYILLSLLLSVVVCTPSVSLSLHLSHYSLTTSVTRWIDYILKYLAIFNNEILNNSVLFLQK